MDPLNHVNFIAATGGQTNSDSLSGPWVPIACTILGIVLTRLFDSFREGKKRRKEQHEAVRLFVSAVPPLIHVLRESIAAMEMIEDEEAVKYYFAEAEHEHILSQSDQEELRSALQMRIRLNQACADAWREAIAAAQTLQRNHESLRKRSVLPQELRMSEWARYRESMETTHRNLLHALRRSLPYSASDSRPVISDLLRGN